MSTIKDIDKLISSISGKYGAGSAIRPLQDRYPKIERVPVDSPKLGDLMGKGGMPRARVIELYGSESSGKTSVACYLAGQFQKAELTQPDGTTRKGSVAYIDAEHAIDFEYSKTFGLNIEETIFSQPDSAEQALAILEELIDSGLVDFVVLDSIAAMATEAELMGDMGDAHIALLPRLMGQSMRRILSRIAKTKTTVLFLNQQRDKIGGFSPVPGRAAQTQPGGRAVKFAASIRMEASRAEYIMGKNGPIGFMCRIKSAKNKTSTPMKKTEIKIIFGEGVQSREEWIDFAIAHGVVDKRGGWYYLNEEDKIQGKDSLIKYMGENPEVYDELITQTRLMMDPNKKDEVVADADSED